MRYNMQDTCFKVHKPNIKTMVADWNEEISETRMIHFTYFKKPWLFSSTHPCKQMYLSYLKRLGGKKISMHDIRYRIKRIIGAMLGKVNKYMKKKDIHFKYCQVHL